MIQFPYEFGLPEEHDSPSSFQREEFRMSKTPSHQGVESETSFDSGYFSPPVSTRAAQSHHRDSVLLPVYQQSPTKDVSNTKTLNSTTALQLNEGEDLTSLPAILDDWDQNFIDNFQENLFGFDNIEDIGYIDGFLKSSPLKSPYKTKFYSPLKMMSYSPGKRLSPVRYQLSPVRGQWSPLANKQFTSINKRTFVTSPIHKTGQLTSDNSTSQLHCDKSMTRQPSPAKVEPATETSKLHGKSKFKSVVHRMSNENVTDCLDPQKDIKQEPAYESITKPVCLPHENTYFQIDDPNFSAVRNVNILKATENFTKIVPFIEVQNASNVFGAPPRKLQRMEPKMALSQIYEQRTVCASKQKLQMARANFKISLDRAVQTAASRHLRTKSDKYPQLSKALTKKPAATANSLTQGDENDLLETDVLPFERYSESAAGSAYEVKCQSDGTVVIKK